MTSKQSVGVAIVLAALWLCSDAQAQPQSAAGELIPVDASSQGYRVDNNELPFKEHVRLPRNVSLRDGGWLDARHFLTNLIADEAGDYWNDRVKKVVLVDSQTGELKTTSYQGDIRCLVDGKLAVSVTGGPKATWTYSYGRYGEALTTLEGGTPDDMELNRWSCQLVSKSSLPRTLADGTKVDWWVRLRVEHGHLLLLRGRPLPANSSDFPSDLQRLMQQPFMRTMGVVSAFEQWILRTPEGKEIPIPNNPGEAAGEFAPVSYVSYLGAYFIPPYSGGRPFDPEELRQVPRFARLLYPDGRAERFGIPDVIWEPYKRKELSFNTYYTRRGLVWEIRSLQNAKAYQGELKLGAYLDLRKDKVLRRLPKINFGQQSPIDGCTVGTRAEATQRHPHYLFTTYYVNLCTEE